MTTLIGTTDGVFAIDEDRSRRAELPGSVTALDAAGGECWAVLDGDQLAHRGRDGSWRTRALAGGRVAMAVLARGGAVLVGTSDAQVVVHNGDDTVLDGFDRVEGRDTWHAVGSRVPYVRSLSATADDQVLLASVHVGGIPRSSDGGTTWRPTVDVDADVHQVRAHPEDARRVFAAAAVGLLESDDGGETWDPPAHAGLHATYLRALAFPTGYVVVSASDGPFGRKPALYRRALTSGPAGTFERCHEGLPEWLPAIVDTGALDASGPRLVAGAADRVFASGDAGTRWEVLAEGLPPVRAVALLDGPTR